MEEPVPIEALAPNLPVPPEEEIEEYDETLLKYCNAIVRLNDLKDSREEIEMKKLLQELNNNLESFLLNSRYISFFVTALPIILQYLNCGSKNYIKEHNDSQIRQLVLELLSRFPLSVTKNCLHQMFPVLYTIMEADNEENACIAFRILVDLLKRIQKNDDLGFNVAFHTKKFLQLIKKFTCMLLQNASKILEPNKPYHVQSMEELDLEPILQEIFVATSLQTESVNCFTLLPRGINSLKLMAEVPINIIMIAQAYRGVVEAENFELLRFALKLVVIQATEEQKSNEMFNLEIFTDFLNVQIKYLSFIAYMARTQEDKIQQYMMVEQLPSIILKFFKLLPDEMTGMRKDLLYSTRYIVGTRFRGTFSPFIEEFFDENLIIGNGWATRETLRSFAYSIVFDLVHHLRDSLGFKELNLAVNIYSKNLYDDSLSLTSHIMSCRLLLNIADSFTKLAEKDKFTINLPKVLWKIFEVHTNKIRLMVDYCIPKLKAKLESSKNEIIDDTNNFNDNRANYKSNIEYMTSSFTDNEEFRLRFGIPEFQNTSLSECRMLGKSLFNSLKVLSIKLNEAAHRYELTLITTNQMVSIRAGCCRLSEIYILVRLFKKGIKFLEIYNMHMFPNTTQNYVFSFARQGGNNQSALYARTKEEKEMFELFGSIFTIMAPQTFRVVLKLCIDHLVKSFSENFNLQQLIQFFLSNKNISNVFVDVLTAYLVQRMEILGNNSPMSSLFLKLFKLVFGSVSLFPFENEKTLQPHLQTLVHNSINMALYAQEPYNYFLLLRALFRSIGNGSHDQLYQEFLPLLPSLLHKLNHFQTGVHRQNMKDIFVELCLTIPVRLSSLLPYLRWLMDPLVSALNGVPSLIAQGLRTLELCVDNLQPDFLYENFQPIHIELMHSLWRIIRCPNENIAQVAFRVLGKIGGACHRMTDPQKLEYNDFRDSFLDENVFDTRQSENVNIHSHGSCVYFNLKFDDSDVLIHLPIDKVIESAYRSLRVYTTDPFYRQQCWTVIKGFLIANIQNFACDEEKQQMYKLFSHSSFSNGTDFGYCSTNSFPSSSTFSTINFYKYPEEKLRKVHEMALKAMLTASAIKELRIQVINFMVPLVRHYTLLAICQQSGPIHTSGQMVKLYGMDPLVLIDAITTVMGQEEKELSKPCNLVLRVIIETTISVLGSKERACQLPLYEYILERVCSLCYERPWYSKYGGCITVRYLFDRMSRRWLFIHQFAILKAMFFVMMDLYQDLSSGVIEMAKDNLEMIVKLCATSLPENSPKELLDLQQKSKNDVLQELLRQISSADTTIREQVMHLLEVWAKTSDCTVSDVIMPHRDVLEDMVPFKKHKLFQQPINVQIGILDVNTFCISLEPKIFLIDINIPEHLNFFNDVYSICCNEEYLKKLPCYKSLDKNLGETLIPLRKAALRTLAACHYLKSMSDKIFIVLYQALIDEHQEIQQCSYECLNKYKYVKDINPELIRNTIRSFLINVSDIRMLGHKEYTLLLRLKNLARLFAYLFNDKFCDHMLQHLIRLIDSCFAFLRRSREKEYEFRIKPTPQQLDLNRQAAQADVTVPQFLNICTEIINLFGEITAADSNYVEMFMSLLNKWEFLLDTYVCRIFYKPLQRFLMRFPKEAINQFETRINEECLFRYFLFLINDEDSDIFRTILYENPCRLLHFLNNSLKNPSTPVNNKNPQIKQELVQQVPTPASNIDVTSSPVILVPSTSSYQRYQAIKIISILIKHNSKWLTNQPELTKLLKTIWLLESFHSTHKNNFMMESRQWEEPRLLVKCLLNYLDHNPTEYEIYFQLLRAFIGKYQTDFEFLREYFIDNVAKKFPVEWKRNAFLKFCELFPTNSSRFKDLSCTLEWSQELKSKILQFIIIPTFAHCFKTGQNTALLGPPLDDDSMQNPTNFDSTPQPNLVSVFLNVLIKETAVSDSIRILVMQLGCLIVEHASNYIRPPQISENERVPRSKRQNAEVRLLMSYAWPGMHTSKRQDSAKRYYCHLLLTHIISKISIHKKIIKQVFHNLLKGHFPESKTIVFSALEILIPVLPQRINDGYRMLRQLTKKLIIEEGHASNQLIHLLQIIVRYYRIYYPTRHIFVPHMVNTMSRFGLAQNSGMEQRKLALDLVEVIIRWEHERVSSKQMDKSDKSADVDSSDSESSFDSKQEQHKANVGQTSQQQETQLSFGSIEKEYSDAILLFLIRFICLAHDFSLSTSSNVTQCNSVFSLNSSMMPDFLCRRAYFLLKDALQSDFWPWNDKSIKFLEKILLSVKDNSSNCINVCMALELLILFLQTLKREQAIQMLIPLQRGISACCTSTNPKVVSTLHNLLTKLMAIVQPSCNTSTISPKSGQPVKGVNDSLETFEQLYTDIHSLILNGFMSYNKVNSSNNLQQLVSANTMNSANINVQIMQNNINQSTAIQTATINSTTATLSQLFSVLMCLKAACINEPMYIDRLSTPFSVMLQKLVKDHITFSTMVVTNPQQQQQQQQSIDFNGALCADIINLCLELIKNRIGALNPETRRTLINNVFMQLIEKSPEIKVMKTLLKIFEEWIKSMPTTNGSRSSSTHLTPLLRDKATLLLRIGQNIEKRFPLDQELNAQYLELIHFIYNESPLKSTDIVTKLEFAFMSGLRCTQPHIRQKFFNLLDGNLPKHIYDRIMYIISSQNWETIGVHYWIRQSINLILSISSTNETITMANQKAKLPLPISLIPLNDNQEKSLFTSFVSNLDSIACTPTDILMNMDLLNYSNTNGNNTEMIDLSDQTNDPTVRKQDENHFLNDIFNEQIIQPQSNTSANVNESKQASDPKQNLLDVVCSFLEKNREFTSWSFFNAVAQICYMDVQLAHHIWIQLFPRIYSILNKSQQLLIALELAPFLTSGIHSLQRELQLSSVNTFFEAISYCDPPIRFRPAILRYLSKNHNVWHRACLQLETELERTYNDQPAIGIGGLITNEIIQANLGSTGQKQNRSFGSLMTNSDKHNTGITSPVNLFPSELPANLSQPYSHECMSALGKIYETLKENDYCVGIWHKRAHYKETLIAIAYEQQGFFEQAKSAYQLAMSKGSSEFNNAVPIPYWLQDEYLLWEKNWIRCSKELNQWDFLLEYASTVDLAKPLLVAESAWRIPDWNAMNQAVILVEQNLPKDYAWKLALYKGYNALCNPSNREIAMAERMAETAANFLIKEWYRLPNIVSEAHISILHGSQQITELQEAYNIHQSLFTPNYSPEKFDLRSVIKTWRNRLPIVSDDLSHWNDIFTWRQHHFQAILAKFEHEMKSQKEHDPPNNALTAAHASAQSLIYLAKIARKHFLINVALDQLNRIHTIPKVPIVDCFQKIRQQIKCYLWKHMLQPSGEELQDAMSVVDCTHLNFFQQDMMAEFIALKGYILMKMKRMEEANHNLSASLQLCDTITKCWSMWAEFNYEMFITSANESFAQRNMQYGIFAVISYLHACRHKSESKVRKFIPPILWLLSYDKENQLAQTLEQYHMGMPLGSWIPWIPHLLNCLVRPEGTVVLSIISQVGRYFPEAVYFPTRSLYLTLKLEQREMKLKFSYFSNAIGINQQMNNQSTDQVQASNGMWRCSRIMHYQRDIHSTLLTSIEGILDQMSWFRESWFEEILRQLRQALTKCYTLAFENRNNVAETITPQHTLNYIKKLATTFGMGIDNATCGPSSSINTSNYSNLNKSNVNDQNAANNNEKIPRTTNSTASETLARRQQSTIQDPDFQKMKQQFANDFDFNIQGSRKLHNLIVKVKKWIKIFEAKTRLLPKSWLLEEKCRYLSNFSNRIISVSLPGEYFTRDDGLSCPVKIARFMPRVEIITKHNTTARRLYIRGHNGKIYPYLILNDSTLSEVRREERILHLLRLLNVSLMKHKETARRSILFTIPKVVPINAQMRFVQDNVSSLSLIDVYKQHMIRRGSDPDAPIAKYYDRMLSLQTKGSQILLPQLKDIISDIQSSMAPKTLLKEWALQTFYTATEYWHFRKLFTYQLGLAGLTEYAFHTTRLNPDMMYIHRDSGLMNIAYYRFDLNEETGELVSNQPVPFRVTYSVQNMITEIGIRGPLTSMMIATTSCLVNPNHKIRFILLAVIRDEIINWHKRIKSNEKVSFISAALTAMANQSVNKNSAKELTNNNDIDAINNNSNNNNDNNNTDNNNNNNNNEQKQQQQKQLLQVFNSPKMGEIPEINGEELVTLGTKATNVIMSRLQNLSTFDGSESNVSALINAAIDPDNLCRMDPAWHPWL